MPSVLEKIWFLFTAAERRKVAGMLVLVVLMAMAETTGVLSIMPFLSVLGRPEVIHSNAWLHAAYERFGFTSSRAFMTALGLASITTVIVSAAFKTLTLHRINRFVHLLRHTLSQRMLARYLHQPYEFFLEHNPSQLSRNVLSEVDQLIFSLIQPLSQMVAQGSMVLAMLALVLWYKPVLALCMVVVVGLLYGTIYGSVRNLLARIGSERQTANGERFQACNEALGGFKDVKVTHSAHAYQEKFDRASRLFSRHMATSDTLSQSPLYLVEAVGYTGLITLALVLMLSRGDIAHVLPALGLFGFATYRMLPAAQIMYRGFAKLRFSVAALDAVYTDLALPDRGDEAAADALVPRREIRFSDVGYAYPSAPGKPVLEHFNLVVPVGSSIGIAGRTGAGKSTLMDLLLGLLHPLNGSITIDGTPLTAANAGAWQRAIGYVPQHIYLADASIAANIAFGVAPEHIDMRAVERAARAAQIHDFVSSELPDGYATTIGDRGIRLSGGQRQRVGIARALYRDPPVLLMDEATSALDSQTEDALNEALRQLAGTKTVVVIAHRATSLRDCHEVVNLTAVSTRGPAADPAATAS